MNQNELRRWRRAHRLCVDCGAPEGTAKGRCEKHRLAYNASQTRSQTRRRRKLVRAGKCRQCGRRAVIKGYCAKHRDHQYAIMNRNNALKRTALARLADLFEENSF